MIRGMWRTGVCDWDSIHISPFPARRGVDPDLLFAYCPARATLAGLRLFGTSFWRLALLRRWTYRGTDRLNYRGGAGGANAAMILSV